MVSPVRRRIALVTSVFPVPWDLTRGRPVFETAKALSEHADVRVFFVTARYPRLPGLRPKGFLYGDLPRDYALPGVDMEAFHYPALPLVSRPLNGFVCDGVLAPRLRAFAPEAVLAYWIYPEGYAALRSARRLGLPCVIGSRGSDIRVRDAVSSHFTGLALRGASQVITVSEELRQQAVHRYGADAARVTTIVNGCNTALFHPQDRRLVRQRLGLATDGRLIVFVGRVVQAKGVMELVAAFARLGAERPDLRLAIVGDGVDMPRVRAAVADSGLADRVALPGAVTPAEVAQWINAGDLLTLPSYSEGYPNVLVEALACGRPVVATDVGGAREIVDDRSGVLIAPADIDALAQGLRQVLDREADAAALSARFGRSWDDVARQTLAVCERAISR